MKSSDRILDYLRKQPYASAPDLSKAIGMTVQNMRHHLQALSRQGWIEEISIPPSGQAGRPQKYYRLSGQGKTGEGLTLLRALLGLFFNNDILSKQDRLICLAKQLADEKLTNIRNPAHRLNQAVKRMTELGYQVRWEARPGSPLLYITYSPYRLFIDEFPWLEVLDSLLMVVMTGYSLKRLPEGKSSRSGGIQIYSIQVE